MRRFAYLFLLMAITATQAVAAPRLSNPVFQSLSTKNGLPQDIVNDIVINSDGFVWIATDGGLVRWDGIRTKRVAGPDNLLFDASIYRLALQGEEALWFSVYGRGVYYLDLESQEVVQIEPTDFRDLEGFVQHGETFHWQSDTQLIIALSEEVQRFNTQTDTLETLAKLPETLLDNKQAIRAAITVEDILVVATTDGVYTKNVNDIAQPLKELDYLADIPANLDNLNAKFLCGFPLFWVSL